MAWRRRLKKALFWAVAVSVIVLAVLVGLIQLALPWWASDADRVARLLSSRLGSPVSIEVAQPQWTASGPVIELHGVRFGAGDDTQMARIERAAWAIDFSGLVRSSRNFSEFRAHGLDITLVRAGDGKWEVLGLPELLRGPERPLASILRGLPAFALRDSRLSIRYAADRPPIKFVLVELRHVGGGGTRWRGRIAPDGVSDAQPIWLSLDLAPAGQSRLHIRGEALALAQWLGPVEPAGMKVLDGSLNASAWVGFNETGVNDVQLEVQQSETVWSTRAAVDAAADVEVTPLARVPALRFGARWQRTEHGSRLRVDGVAFADGQPGHALGVGDANGFRLQAQGLELAPMATFAMLADTTPAPLRRWLHAAQPSGRVSALDLHSDSNGWRQVTMTLEGLQAVAGGGLPGIAGLSARLHADREGLSLWPGAQEMVLDYPGVFAAPIPLRFTAGAISAWREDGHWRLGMDRLVVAGTGFNAELAGGIRFPAQEPVLLDLGVRVLDAQIEAAKPFWPLNRIPNTARWLNRALQGGRVVQGRAWLRGPAGAFPFRDHSGRFEAAIEVADAGLDYHTDWPALSDIQAELDFQNMSLRIASDSARVQGLQVSESTGLIEDLKQPILIAQTQARGSGEQLLTALKGTPIERRHGSHLIGMQLSGEPRLALDLRVPLKRELGEASVDGRVVFAGERFTDSKWDLDFTDLAGELRFTRNSLSAQALQVSVAGEPANLDLRIGSTVTDPAAAVEAELRGRLSAGAVFAGIDALAPLVAAAQGRADWRVRVHVPDTAVPTTATAGEPTTAEPAIAASASKGQGWIRVESDLKGIALTLPAPLAKAADSALPLRLQTSTQTQAAPIELRLGQLLRLRAHVAGPGRPFAGAIAFGGAAPEQLPARGLVVTGQVPALDLSGWLALDSRAEIVAQSAAAQDSVDWPRVILRAGELGVLGRGFREVDLQMQPGTDSVDVRLLGPDIEGTISWPKAAPGRVVRARFQRLHVPAGPSAELGGALAPSAMPALDVEAEDLRVGASRLGRTRLQAQVRDGSYRIERFESRSEAFELDASGDWRRENGQDMSDLAIQLRADDVGAMLESFGFSRLMVGGRTQIGIDGRWQGSPAAFALERIDGTLSLKVGSGRIVDVDPGVGRLFGLLNLREIPRRLILDFRDLFSKGLKFNSIEGSFQLDVGEAYTDNLLLKSPSADILVTGRTGLILRDYDQTLEVSPRMGGALPVVGAVAGGPAGAAAGLLLQGLLRIDDAAKITYRVTGPWDKPEIVKQAPAASADRRESGRDDQTPAESGPRSP